MVARAPVSRIAATPTAAHLGDLLRAFHALDPETSAARTRIEATEITQPRRPPGSPDIGYSIELTRHNIPESFRVSLYGSW